MRRLRQEEAEVLATLLGMVPSSARPPLEPELQAVDLSDGGMGSIRFANPAGYPRKMGRELVTAYYIDEDQVPVSISINVDETGHLFEMDFWKVDFSPLKRYPRPELLHVGQPGPMKA